MNADASILLYYHHHTIRWIVSFLIKRTQMVVVNDLASESLSTFAVSPQRCGLATFSFHYFVS